MNNIQNFGYTSSVVCFYMLDTPQYALPKVGSLQNVFLKTFEQ